MKKIYTTIVAIIAIAQISYGQWTSSGSNIYYNTGGVGIGTTSPGSNLLDVNGVAAFGVPASTGTQLLVRGGTSGGNMLTLVRSGSAPSQFSLGLAGGGLSFRDDNNSVIVGNMFSTPTTNSFYLGQMGTIQLGYSNRNSLISATTISSVTGSDLPAGSLTVQGGLGTGAGTPGDIYFNTGTSLASGTTSQSSSIRMTIKNNTGYVGIGTTRPDAELTVYGTIHSKEVKVNTSILVPDYVFEPAYKLPLLSDLKTYLDANHHLPEIPSAKEIEKDGINLSEMNLKLLKKVEELTLYIIEKDNQLSAQQKQIEQLKKEQGDRIAALEAALSKLGSGK